MRGVLVSLVLVATSLSAVASEIPCESRLAGAIERAAKASNVSIDHARDLGVTSKGEEHYSVLAYYSDSACEGDSQTFQIYTKKDSCRVVAIHANGDEDCGD